MKRGLTMHMLTAQGDAYANTTLEKVAAIRAVCGARSVRDAADARHLLTMLGLLEPAAEVTA